MASTRKIEIHRTATPRIALVPLAPSKPLLDGKKPRIKVPGDI